MTGRKNRAIRRNERIIRRQLTAAIESGDTIGIKDLSEKYGKALMDLYLLLKREMTEKELLDEIDERSKGVNGGSNGL